MNNFKIIHLWGFFGNNKEATPQKIEKQIVYTFNMTQFFRMIYFEP